MIGVPQTISIAVGAALSLVLDYRLLIAIMASVTLACGVALVLRGAKTPTVTDPAEPLPASLVA